MRYPGGGAKPTKLDTNKINYRDHLRIFALPLSLRTVALVAAILTLIGFFLVFLPDIQNPILFGAPTTEPTPFYVLPGLIISLVGMGLLLYSWFAFLRSRNWLRANRAKTLAAYKMSYRAALAGALALWIARTATHLAFPNLPVHATIQPPFDVGAIIFSLIVGFAIAYYLVRYYDGIPFRNPVAKCVVLSTLALVILGGLATLINEGGAFYFSVYILYEAAAFTVSGITIGLVYSRTYGAQSPPPLMEVGRPLERRWWIYFIAILAIVLSIEGYGFYQSSLQPVSFTATSIHFDLSNGTIQVIANVTNTSSPSIVQVDAAIDQFDDGVCGYGISTNQTMVCRFVLVPLLPCSQIYPAYYHTLRLSAYFGNTRTLAHSYQVTSVQMGCGGP